MHEHNLLHVCSVLHSEMLNVDKKLACIVEFISSNEVHFCIPNVYVSTDKHVSSHPSYVQPVEV